MSIVSTFNDRLQEARILLNSGQFNIAYSRISQEQARQPDELFAQLSIMSDVGVALGNSQILNGCISLMEKRAQDVLAVPSLVPYHWFNLANLHANILAISEAHGTERPWYDRSMTALARKAYRLAADNSGSDNLLKSAIHCAHARLLVGLGRDKEAFGLFHKATILDSNNKNAELGRIEMLVALSGTAPSLDRILLEEAGGKLARSEQNGSLPDEDWDDVKQLIHSRLGKNDVQEPEYPKNTVETKNDREYQTILHTLKNQLYLTPCAMCRGCDRAIGDAEVLGVKHAMLGGNVADRYRNTARLTGRLAERHRALRMAIIDFIREKEDPESEKSRYRLPDLADWQPASLTASALMTALSGSYVMLEGMAACITLHPGLEQSQHIDIARIFGTPRKPGEVRKSTNPALHGFWDLWADGMEGVKVPIIMDLSGSMSSAIAEELLADTEAMIEAALAWASWLGLLISQIIRMADRDARGNTDPPPLWPLQPFRCPSDS